MNGILPDLIAFDFDGVICDGLVEYFQTAWRTYCQLYHPASEVPPAGLAERFYRLRPVIETGWEMPVLLRSLLAGDSDEQIIRHWPQMAAPYLSEAGLSKQAAASALDGVRDRSIQTDLEGWLGLHRFYPRILTVLQAALAQIPTYIVSTKEGRFIDRLLQQSGVEMPTEQILGKEVNRPKFETLRTLMGQHESGWFVEDRLGALQGVKAQPDLARVTLFLADWGYNLPVDREVARQDERIHLLSLDELVQQFVSAPG